MAKANNAPIAISPSIVLGATTSLDIIISTPVPSTYRVASHGDLNLILGADGSLSFGPVTLPPSSFPFDGLPHAITISLSATSISMQVDDGASYSAPYTPTSASPSLHRGGRNHEAPWAIGLSVHDIMVPIRWHFTSLCLRFLRSSWSHGLIPNACMPLRMYWRAAQSAFHRFLIASHASRIGRA